MIGRAVRVQTRAHAFAALSGFNQLPGVGLLLRCEFRRMYIFAQPVAPQPLWQLILGLGLTGSIVGAVVAAVASALNDRTRKRFELQKWRADFYLRPKLEALRDLHAAMVRCHYEFVRAEPQTETLKLQEYQEQVERPERDFFATLNVAEIYIDPESMGIMRVVLGAVRQMRKSIWLRLPEVVEQRGHAADTALREPEWQSFSRSFDAAQARLKHILHPTELMKWIENDH